MISVLDAVAEAILGVAQRPDPRHGIAVDLVKQHGTGLAQGEDPAILGEDLEVAVASVGIGVLDDLGEGIATRAVLRPVEAMHARNQHQALVAPTKRIGLLEFEGPIRTVERERAVAATDRRGDPPKREPDAERTVLRGASILERQLRRHRPHARRDVERDRVDGLAGRRDPGAPGQRADLRRRIEHNGLPAKLLDLVRERDRGWWRWRWRCHASAWRDLDRGGATAARRSEQQRERGDRERGAKRTNRHGSSNEHTERPPVVPRRRLRWMTNLAGRLESTAPSSDHGRATARS
ncbi:hypothetical protein OEB96_05645 [Paraliomyxa miuraensis]|nr:hypothetical protein [Paraliomyxa miuraensis]MCX4240088.1 hypothetical protein [Paraliomyxa miuraensis]